MFQAGIYQKDTKNTKVMTVDKRAKGQKSRQCCPGKAALIHSANNIARQDLNHRGVGTDCLSA